MAKLSDIFQDGLERDVALKRANEASQPTGPLTVGMAVDRFSGALRALRSGRLGSQQSAPGPDYGQDMGDPLELIAQAAIPVGLGWIDTELFDTHRWDWMLVTVQSDVTHANTLPMYIQVYGLASLLTADLVFAHPLWGNTAIQTFVVPVLHTTHMIRVHLPAGYTAADLYITVERLPPGHPTGSGQAQHVILGAPDLTTQNLVLAHFFDRSCRGFILNALVSAVSNPTTRIASLEIRPWTGNAATPLWSVPLGISAPVHTVARIPNQGPVTIWWHTTGVVGPGWTVDVDFTPIYAA